MAQYQTITIQAHPLDLNPAIDAETRNQGRHGWRVLDVTPVGDREARVQFVKD